MSTLTQLEYLLAVDSERHFGNAAKSCNVSQPSLSAQIQKLEDELEVVIFDRSRKPILATEAGKDIIEQARIVLREHKKIKVIADLKASEPKGDFDLAVIPTLASYVIPLFIGAFAETFPKVNLRVHEHTTENILKLLHEDALDAGLLVTPLNDDSLIERHLYYEPFYCYLNQDHPLQKKKKIAEGDLTQDDLWLLSEGHCFRSQVLRLCGSSEQHGVFPNLSFEGGNFDTLTKLVRTNSGFTLLPQMAVDDLSTEDTETHIKAFAEPIPTREVSLVYNRTFLKETIIGALEESIIQNLPGHIRSLKRQNVNVVDI